MSNNKQKKSIAIIGGGPSALFLYKRLVELGRQDIEITVFEKKAQLGSGMPYSPDGAGKEHVTNVSDNEIPTIVTSIEEWLKTAPGDLLECFAINPQNFNEYKVLPRLFFGEYLSAQFRLLQNKAQKIGMVTEVYCNTTVTDIAVKPDDKKTTVTTDRIGTKNFDAVIVCTGHRWPRHHEGVIPNYFDSPYPPSKLRLKLNEPVAIKGSSLTAIDAIRTLARANGQFVKKKDGRLSFQIAEGSENVRLVMHSRSGLLPVIRIHLEDSHLSKESVLSKEEVEEARHLNDGFIPLDYLFRRNFKEPFKEEDPAFYEKIKDLTIEEFVESMMELRERLDPFVLFKAEYAEAEKSIRRKEPVYWKEMLAVLSFAMNYPAKYLSAEDMLRLQNVLMPLISIVIAFVPQSSADEMLALYEAGILTLVAVGNDSKIVPQQNGGAVYQYTDEEGNSQAIPYGVFVDCTGQPHLAYHDFPFKTLLEDGVVSAAMLKFRYAERGNAEIENGNEAVIKNEEAYYLNVPGIAINDNFQVLDSFGAANERIYVMAVPYIGGYNPDYSGLDFCEAASARIVASLLST